MPPTLFVPGSLRDPDGNVANQATLDSIVPIDYSTKWFKDRINLTGLHNRLLILKAGTASGKSTGFVAETYLRVVVNSPHGRRGLICTQPRIITAIKNVLQITPFYKQLKIGHDIGWSTQYDKMRPKRFGILSATVGTLTAQMSLASDEDIMNSYQMILIDETHERNLQTDSVILMLYNFMKRNADNIRCPFIVFMSATFDPTVFTSFFRALDPEVSLTNNFIHVVGQAVGYDIMWPDRIDPKKKIWELAAETVNDICRTGSEDPEDSCDILIFMPGSVEIEETSKALVPIVDKLHHEGFGLCAVLPISAKEVELNSESYRNLDKLNADIRIRAKDPTTGKETLQAPRRKIVISTAVAETGLTLDQLKYVIETGFHRATLFNPNFSINTLLTESAPKSRVTQRFGRVGRKTRGTVRPLYTRQTYEHFLDQQFPEIIVNDFGDILLSVLMEQVKDSSGQVDIERDIDISEINMLTNPAISMKEMALEKAYKLGLIRPKISNTEDSNNINKIRLTKIGAVSSKLSLKLTSARLLASGHIFGYSVYDLVGLIAALEESSARDFEKAKIQDIYTAVYGISGPRIKALLSDDFIDLLVIVSFIVLQFDAGIPDLMAICAQYKLPHETIKYILIRRDQLMNNMLTLGYNVTMEHSIIPARLPANGPVDIGGANIMQKNSEDQFTDNITRLKYCIHDSFKTNMIELVDGIYKHKGLKVSVPHFKRSEIQQLLGSANDSGEVIFPKYLIFDQLTGSVSGGIYKIVASRVSTVSGYCYLDMY